MGKQGETQTVAERRPTLPFTDPELFCVTSSCRWVPHRAESLMF